MEDTQNFYFFGEGMRFAKKNDSDKYVVCTCAKNENDYIIEWIEHYLGLGFDKIFICDNNDDDSLDSLLSEYVNSGTVEIFNCRGLSSIQEKVYNSFCAEGNYKWCAYFDCDEFLELGVYSNIKDYLETKNEDCIAFNWVIFGSGGEISKKNGRVQDRFKVPYLPLLNLNNGFVKGIVKGGKNRFKNFSFIGGHLPFEDPDFCTNTYNVGGYNLVKSSPYQTSYPLRYKEGYIKHYYTKSFNEWMDKAKRGWPLNNEELPYYRYFCLSSEINASRKRYDINLFLKAEWMSFSVKDILEYFNGHKVVELIFENESKFAFISKILYIFGQVEGKVILLLPQSKVDSIDDVTFTLLLEHSFVTGNKIVYCKNANEVDIAFCKYCGTDTEYYFKLM